MYVGYQTKTDILSRRPPAFCAALRPPTLGATGLFVTSEVLLRSAVLHTRSRQDFVFTFDQMRSVG